jgi:hypothetical protein
VPPTTQLAEIACREVWKELVNYMEGDLTLELRERICRHLLSCDHCKAIYDGSHNVVRLLGGENTIELPEGFGKRLRDRFLASLPADEQDFRGRLDH